MARTGTFLCRACIVLGLLLVPALSSAQTIGTPGVPSGFGLAGGVAAVSVSGSYGSSRGGPDDTRFDASTALTLGFGNPVTGVGLQGGVNLTSFRNFGASGFFTLGAHKMFQTSGKGIYSVALTGSQIAPWGDSADQEIAMQIVGSYLTSVGGRLALFTLGAGNDSDGENSVIGMIGAGIGITDRVAVSVGQVDQRTSLGLTFSPDYFAGNSVSVSLNYDRVEDDTKLTVDLGRVFALMGGR